jgi:glyoxylase-like metal-dependent hydrolase (beta-lactamase superfamily II)
MEIVPGIHQVDGVNGNCYVLLRDGLVLIDTGLPDSSVKILSYIRDRMKRDPAAITTIVLTHHHIDHTGNVAAIKKVSSAKAAIHAEDSPYLAGKKAGHKPRGMKGLAIRSLSFFMRAEHVEPDILLSDNDTVAGLTVIHIPGHTPGSIALLDKKNGVLFSGDTVRFNGTYVEGPPPQFTPDPEAARRSIKKLSALEFDVMLAGHGVPLKGGAAGKVREFAATMGA